MPYLLSAGWVIYYTFQTLTAFYLFGVGLPEGSTGTIRKVSSRASSWYAASLGAHNMEGGPRASEVTGGNSANGENDGVSEGNRLVSGGPEHFLDEELP